MHFPNGPLTIVIPPRPVALRAPMPYTDSTGRMTAGTRRADEEDINEEDIFEYTAGHIVRQGKEDIPQPGGIL